MCQEKNLKKLKNGKIKSTKMYLASNHLGKHSKELNGISDKIKFKITRKSPKKVNSVPERY